MNEAEYVTFVKKMASIHGISSLANLRRGMEQIYYHHHYVAGIRLRGKYRPR